MNGGNQTNVLQSIGFTLSSPRTFTVSFYIWEPCWKERWDVEQSCIRFSVQRFTGYSLHTSGYKMEILERDFAIYKLWIDQIWTIATFQLLLSTVVHMHLTGVGATVQSHGSSMRNRLLPSCKRIDILD